VTSRFFENNKMDFLGVWYANCGMPRKQNSVLLEITRFPRKQKVEVWVFETSCAEKLDELLCLASHPQIKLVKIELIYVIIEKVQFHAVDTICKFE